MSTRQLQYYIDCIDQGIKIYWQTLGKGRGMRIHSSDIQWAISEDRTGPERIFDVQLSADTALARIDEIALEIQKGVLPNGLLITPKSSPPNIVELLGAKGFDIDSSSPGMVMDLEGLRLLNKPDDSIEIIKVADEDSLKSWVNIVNNDFHIMSYEQLHDIYSLSEVSLYLSVYQDIPVGTFMIIRNATLATLEMVNTLKEYQRKGIATYALTHILSELKAAGTDIITLRSSTEGIPLYTKIGFKEYCKRILATYGQE